MKILRLLLFLLFFITIQLFEMILNVVFLPFEFQLEIFLVALVFIGTFFNSEKFIFPIFLTGLFYDLFFSSFYIGVYSGLYILILLFVNYANVKISKRYFQKAIVFLLSFIMYNFLDFVDLKTTFFTYGSLVTLLTSFLVFISLERFVKPNV